MGLAGEIFNLGPRGRPGQPPDYRKCGSAGLPKGHPERAPFWAHFRVHFGPVLGSILSHFWGPFWEAGRTPFPIVLGLAWPASRAEVKRFFSHWLGGENSLTSAPEAGQASPKTIGNGIRPASQKGPQKWPTMEPKTGPKWARKEPSGFRVHPLNRLGTSAAAA